MSDCRFWIGIACRDHVLKGVTGSYAQVCHGKCSPLQRMKTGDWLAYYSPRLHFEKADPCQAFVAIGRVVDGRVYPFDMGGGFVPFRIDMAFMEGTQAAIQPLLDRLEFIKDKKRWGFPFRRGHFEIGQKDFEVIARAMGLDISTKEKASA